MNNRANDMLAAWIVLLSVLFVGLKLGNVIEWGWGWVLSPIWAPNGAVLLWAAGQVCAEEARRWQAKRRETRREKYQPKHAKKGWLSCWG